MFYKNRVVSIYYSPDPIPDDGGLVLPLDNREYIEKTRRLVEQIRFCQEQIEKCNVVGLPKTNIFGLPN